MKLKLLQDQNDEMHSCATMCILSKCHHFQDFKVSEDSCQDLNRRCVCVNYPDNLILNVLIHSKFMVGGIGNPHIHSSNSFQIQSSFCLLIVAVHAHFANQILPVCATF